MHAKGKGKARADDALGLDSVLSLFGQWAQEKSGDEPLVVAVVGFTNVRSYSGLIMVLFLTLFLGRQERIR